ncbi:MAG TPA: type II toxin-antitoxin system HicA family toxin [Acidothermaceae bacterium]
MKRRALTKTINDAARVAGVSWTLERQGASHEIWRCGLVRVTIPRHREINEITAGSIVKQLDAVLGEGWWK